MYMALPTAPHKNRLKGLGTGPTEDLQQEKFRDVDYVTYPVTMERKNLLGDDHFAFPH